MTQPGKKTIEELAAMSGTERKAYLLTLSEEELKTINQEELLRAIDAATVKMLAESLNKHTETNDSS